MTFNSVNINYCAFFFHLAMPQLWSFEKTRTDLTPVTMSNEKYTILIALLNRFIKNVDITKSCFG